MMKANEQARVEKPNGEILGPYKAMFAGDTIIIDNPKADVEEGDTILRQLPNGKDERSLVTNATYFDSGIGDFGPHYQIKFKKGVNSVENKSVQNFHINNAQSVQIGDFNTQTIVNSFDALVQRIESSSVPHEEKEEAKTLLSKFLIHPAVVAILGAAAGSVIK